MKHGLTPDRQTDRQKDRQTRISEADCLSVH